MTEAFNALAKSGSGKGHDSKKKRGRSTSETHQLLMDDPDSSVVVFETGSTKSHTDSVFKKIKRRLSMGSKGSKEDKVPPSVSHQHHPKATHKRATSDSVDTTTLQALHAQPLPMYSVFTHAPPILLSADVDVSYFTPKNVYLNLVAEMRNANDEQIEALTENHALAISTLTAEVRELKKSSMDILRTLHGVPVARTVLKDRSVTRSISETPGCFSCFSSFFGAD